jgi:hypothetical protein
MADIVARRFTVTLGADPRGRVTMALFDNRSAREADELSGSDAATRRSVTVVENDFVEAVYAKISSVYDFTFGPTLHPGRLQAIQRMAIEPGDRVLEVGVGTGINLPLTPRKPPSPASTSRRRCWRRREADGAEGRATPGCCRWTRRT